ncbi:MAG: hypothetical protein JWM68_2126 [Verrucomicrobiales bacterium]|nr:hypothetical protein [Verrucomicrobiales bacterium]
MELPWSFDVGSCSFFPPMSVKPTDVSAPPLTADLPGLCLAITEHAPLPIATVDGATHILRYVNPAFCHLMEMSREELLGKAISEILPAKDQCMTLLDQVYRQKKSISHIEQEKDKPHPVFWSYLMWPVVANELLVGVMIQVTETAKLHGDTVAVNEALMIGSLRQHELTEAAENLNAQLLREMTERQKMELLLSERARLLDLSNDAIIVRNFEGEIIYWNHGAEELYGWSREEAVGQVIHSLLQTQFPTDLKHITEELNRNGRWTGELKQTKRNGQHIIVLARKSLDRDARGNPAGVLESITDITERMRVKEALRASEERYRTLFNSIDEGFCVIDMIFDQHQKPVDYRFLEVNPSFEKQTGLPDATGHCISELVPGFETLWFELYGKVALTGEPVRLAAEAKAMGRWFDVFAFRLGGPESRKVAVLINNITERMLTEESLRTSRAEISHHAEVLETQVVDRTVKLGDSIRSLESLNYTMAHDLRAPIRAMMSFTAAMVEDVPLDDTGKMYAEKINRAAQRMDQLVTDLLAYGELSHIPFPLRSLDLGTQVEACLKENAPRIEALQARIEVREPLPTVSASETPLQQILSNLLLNALKFSRPGVTPQVIIRAETRAGVVRLWVEDNGIGIEPQYQERIFGVFQRLHTTQEYPGTGVGLAIVKRAVERMGGRVGVESELGKGSRFWIELPAAKAGPFFPSTLPTAI